MREVEILAPAGSLDSLYAALKLGADAVYTGTDRFGARAFANNPGVDELIEAITYAHLRRKKIYLTVNTLLSDRELEEDLFPMIAPLYEAGLDACIVQDFGVLSFLHENFPDMELHASTQMTILSGEEAELYRDLGITRFVPARECTIEEIRQMREQTDLEIEVFVHGALCYCYSGQCLMSEVIGGRSGNRGMCAQPCRLPFESSFGKTHLFSTKDMCTLLHIPELVEAGIDSFKIEGRMKKKEYSAYLASLYRHYVDLYQEEGRTIYQTLVQNPDSELWRDIRRSQDIYNRGGFSGGYLFETQKKDVMYPGKNGHYGTLVGEVVRVGKGRAVFQTCEKIHYQDVLEFRLQDNTKAYEYTVKNPAERGEYVTCNVKRGSRIFRGQKVYRTKNMALLEWVDEQIEKTDDCLTLTGNFCGKIGEPVSLTVTGEGTTVHMSGPVLQRAEKRPVSPEDIRNRLEKMGNTSYQWGELEVRLEENGFLPLGEVGKMRRKAIAAWEKSAVNQRNPVCQGEHVGRKILSWEGPSLLSVADRNQLAVAAETDPERVLIHLKLEDFPWKEWDELPQLTAGREVAVSFPRILRGKSYQHFLKQWDKAELWRQMQVSVIVVNSHRSILLARQYFPQASRIADDNFYHTNYRAKEVLGRYGIFPSVPVCYGRTEVMVTEGCLKRTMNHCDGIHERIAICSPKKDEFVVVNHCDSCYNTIYTQRTYEKKEMDSVKRFVFTWESPEEMRKVLKKWNLL